MNRGSERALSRAACSKAAFNVGATAIRNSAFFISVFRAADNQSNALALYTNFLSEAVDYVVCRLSQGLGGPSDAKAHLC